MPYRFPAPTAKIAERIDRDHFAEIAARRGELSTLPEAKRAWSRQIRKSGARMRRIEGFCLMADDSIALVSVGALGAHRIEWNFGRA